MIGIEICIDVPDLKRGIRFYADAFGFSKISEPYPGVAVLQAGHGSIAFCADPFGNGFRILESNA